MGNVREHAIREMKLAGVDEDIYGDMTSKAVLKMIDAFESEGHSGMSASLVLSIFNRVIDFGNLTPLTNDPDEWHDHGRENGRWQNKRNSSAFSTDQGRSYYLVDESNWENDDKGRRVRHVTYYQTERTWSPPAVESGVAPEAEQEQSNG